MNEQVLVKTIQSLSQEVAQLVLDKNLIKAELESVKEENGRLNEQIQKLLKESE